MGTHAAGGFLAFEVERSGDTETNARKNYRLRVKRPLTHLSLFAES
jgi:hypothetical protein